MRRLLLAVLLTAPAAAQPERFEKLIPQVEKIRTLQFQTKVPWSASSADQMRARFSAEATEEAPQAADDAFPFLLEKLGMVPAGFQLKQSLATLYGQQVSGLYDPDTRQFVVVGSEKAATPDQYTKEEITAVHELDHALQDQHFSLKALLDKGTNGDGRLAARSVAEGDASLVTTAYQLRVSGLGLDQIKKGQLLSRFKLDGKAPLVLERYLTFPYGPGQELVLAVYRAGGWPLVNQMYQDPPQSSEQVLHPEKYLDERDPPLKLTLKLPASWQGWEQADEDTGGEFLVRAFLESHKLPPTGSNGWGGDVYRVYRKGPQQMGFWLVHWDSPGKAAAFARAAKPFARAHPVGTQAVALLLDVPPELEKELLAELAQVSVQPERVTVLVKRPASREAAGSLEASAKLEHELRGQEFISKNYGFAVTVPTGWGAEPGTEAAPQVPVRFVRSQGRTMAAFIVVRLPEEETTDAKELEAELQKELRGFRITGNKKVVLGNQPFVEYLAEGSGTRFSVFRGKVSGWTYTILLKSPPDIYERARTELFAALTKMKFGGD